MANELEVGIFPEEVVTKPDRKRFAPWHKPRKQYVRNKHLLVAAATVWKEKPQHQKTSLSYLGLPGADFLDLRCLVSSSSWQSDDEEAQGLTSDNPQPKSIPAPEIRFVGFDKEAEDERLIIRDATNVSFDQFMRHERVNQDSILTRDDFRRIGQSDSKAYDDVRSVGPFDVVNLDLCDSLFKDDPSKNDHNLYKALGNLFALQRRVHTSWALLITTRVDQIGLNKAMLPELTAILQKNAAEVSDFYAKFEAFLEVSIDDWEKSTGTAFQDGLCIAMLKWILIRGEEFEFKVKFLPLKCYSVSGTNYDMVSFACVLRQRNCALPMTEQERALAPTGSYERTQALPAIRRVEEMENVDRLFSKDPELEHKFIVETQELLEKCGYNGDHYRKWLSGGLE